MNYGVKTKFSRCKEEGIECDGCGCEIQIDQPIYSINFESRMTEIFLCEDCGNDMQNDMSDDYSKFVDLGE